MQATANRPEYLGALLEDRSRLVLVSVDPDQPWEAFKRLRRQLRKEAHSAQPIVDIFEAPVALERKPADVISLDDRRRAG